MRKTRKKSVIRLVIMSVVIAGLIAGALIYHYSNNKTSKNLAVTETHSTVKAATSTPTAPAPPTNGTLNPGGTVDKNGQTTGNPPPSSDWVSSASGAITLQQPSPNSSLTNGGTISGTASVSNVTFILTDTSVGLIDQGNLNVVNGKFSGLLEFKAHSASGKFQVYYPNPANGGEEDIVKIDVNFST